MIERRSAERLRIHLEAKWEGVLGFASGTIGDISTGGCYVMTGGRVQEKELIRIDVALPTEDTVLLWGEVTNYVPEIGFGLKFTGFGDEEQAALDRLFKYCGQTRSEKKETKIDDDRARGAVQAGPPPSATSRPTPAEPPAIEQPVNLSDEALQLKGLALETKAMIADTLAGMDLIMDAFESAPSQKDLQARLGRWFRLATEAIALMPYGELRRALKNGANVIQQAFFLHAHENGLMSRNPTIEYIEETYQLEAIPASERARYLIGAFAAAHRDVAFRIAGAAGIL